LRNHADEATACYLAGLFILHHYFLSAYSTRSALLPVNTSQIVKDGSSFRQSLLLNILA
jgi:hypothetical protein